MPELDAERRERLAEALEDHVGSERGGKGAWCVKCLCGHDTAVNHWPGDAWDDHRIHVADALAPLIAGWLVEAWDAGYSYAADDDPRALKANPYRAGEPT